METYQLHRTKHFGDCRLSKLFLLARQILQAQIYSVHTADRLKCIVWNQFTEKFSVYIVERVYSDFNKKSNLEINKKMLNFDEFNLILSVLNWIIVIPKFSAAVTFK